MVENKERLLDDHKLMINGATSQYDRWLKALDPGYAPVDGHSFSEMLQFAVDFGGLINFFNLNDDVDGDWVDFFLCDPGVIMASIEAIDLSKIENSFFSSLNQTIETAQSDKKFSLFTDCFLFIHRLAQQMNDWLYALEMIEANKAIQIFRNDLQVLIRDRLVTQFDRLRAYAKGASTNQGLNKTIVLDFSSLMPIWDLGTVRSDDSIYSGDSFEQKIDCACNYLRPIFDEFFAAIAELKITGHPQYQSEDINRNIRPQVALLMAFIRLYQRAQTTINTMSERYIRFYYDEVLREKRDAAIPDSLFLNFTLADGESVNCAPVPVGTLFSAGQGKDGEEVIYVADKSLLVHVAEIDKLQTLHVDSGPLLFEQAYLGKIGINKTEIDKTGLEQTGIDEKHTGNKELSLSSHVVKRILTSEIAFEKTKNDPDFEWPVFGVPFDSGESNLEGIASGDSSSLAQMGFAIATPYLWLSGGERHVSLDIQYTEAYYEFVLKPLLRKIQGVTGESKEDIFYKVLTNAFVLYGSSTAQWFEIGDYSVCSPIEQSSDPCCFSLDSEQTSNNESGLVRTFRLCFTLPVTAPPLVPFATEDTVEVDEESSVDDLLNIHVAGIDQTVPALLVYLRQQPVSFSTCSGSCVNVYPLSLLDKMLVESFQVNTNVSGLSDLKLINTDGEIDSSSPFTVFGGLPVEGSYLQIYQQELFVKVPHQLNITIEWFNLPQNDTGFKGYYQDYDIDIDGNADSELFNNQIFHGKFSLVNQGMWSLKTVPYRDKSLRLGDQQVYLFSTNTDDDMCIIPPQKEKSLCNDSLFNNFKTSFSEQKYSTYYNPIESSIKLELSGPSYGFGYDLYAKNVLNAVVEDLPNTDSCRDNCLCECRPLSDAIDCLNASMEICLKNPTQYECLSCVEKKLFLGETALCAAIIQCLSDCLLKYNDLFDENIYKRIEKHIESCMKLHSSARLKAVKYCLHTIRNVSGQYKDVVDESCWEKCINLFEALKLMQETGSCVQKCESEPSEESIACMQNCLQASLDKLQMLYELCLTECMDDCMEIEQELKYPNEPYLPQALNVKVHYNATCELFDGNQGKIIQPNNGCDRGSFFHILPFNGYREVDLTKTGAVPLLARYAQSGNLYIGFSKLTQMQQLTLLFLMKENNGVDLPKVQWDLLSENRWQCLSSDNIDSDTTHGLQNTGIVTLDIPQVNDVNNTILSAEHTWLRVSTKKHANLYPNANAIIPHALPASLYINNAKIEGESGVDSEDGLEQLGGEQSTLEQAGIKQTMNVIKNRLFQPLPAHSINSSVEALPDIGDIDQPIASFGGRPAETYRTFDIRMGERLRHKQRSIQIWDYERLVLQQFPMIWKVKVLPAHNAHIGNRPGEVLLVVLIGSDSINSQDPTTPRASHNLLKRIQTYIQKHASLFVQVHVCNPVYVRINVNAKVVFKQQGDGTATTERLNNELVQYLSPWFYDEARAAKGGNYASQNDISAFIQTRPYINSLESIEFEYFPKLNALEADWYFLTSAKKHNVTTLSDESCDEIEFSY